MEFLDEMFCIAFRKIFEFFTIEFLPIGPLKFSNLRKIPITKFSFRFNIRYSFGRPS